MNNMNTMAPAGGGQSPWDAQNQAAAGNPGGGDGYRAVREWGEYDKVRQRGLPYGFTGPIYDANTQARMRRFCPEWDGDMGWPPPGFLEQEALYTQRADALEQQQQRGSGYAGPVPGGSQWVAPLSPLEAHAQRCDHLTQQAFARNDVMWAKIDARDAQDRQRREGQQGKAQDHYHARQMQQAQFDHERKMRQMEINAQQRGWGR